jgi:UPF0288 family protein (methanogenesis marker protein 3)
VLKRPRTAHFFIKSATNSPLSFDNRPHVELKKAATAAQDQAIQLVKMGKNGGFLYVFKEKRPNTWY